MVACNDIDKYSSISHSSQRKFPHNYFLVKINNAGSVCDYLSQLQGTEQLYKDYIDHYGTTMHVIHALECDSYYRTVLASAREAAVARYSGI